MTETTDIKALREAALKATKGEWRAFTDIRSGTCAVHTPEDKGCGDIVDWPGFDSAAGSKKQKVANAKFIAMANPATILALLDQLEAERHRADELEAAALAMRDDMRLAREELAALRGEQEPVAWIVEGDGCPTHLTSNKQYAHQYPNRTVTPLFTQPKPVVDLTNVLKVPYRISGQSFAAYDSDDLHAALEADGIVVNDGELATITCWSCRKSMNLAQHSSNDGLCPHCNVEIDLEE